MLVIGLQLENSSQSRVRFLISGCTFPFLSDVGKTPVFKEVFIVSVIGLARTSVDCFKTQVGKGSRQHDLGFDFSISSFFYNLLTLQQTQ